MSWSRSKNKWNRKKEILGGTKYWISSNSNDYVMLKDDFYFLIKEGNTWEWERYGNNSSKFLLSESEFRKLKGFVPIKFKKLQIYMTRKGRLGKPTWTFGHLGRLTGEFMEEMERLRIINVREDRLSKILG